MVPLNYILSFLLSFLFSSFLLLPVQCSLMFTTSFLVGLQVNSVQLSVKEEEEEVGSRPSRLKEKEGKAAGRSPVHLLAAEMTAHSVTRSTL
jgi:hypothetical protein